MSPSAESRACHSKTAVCLDHKAMLVTNTAPLSTFNPTSSVCVLSVQYVICASCRVSRVIHVTHSDLTLLLPRKIKIISLFLFSSFSHYFYSGSVSKSCKLKGFLTPSRCRSLSWAPVFNLWWQIWCGHSEIIWIQQRKEIHGGGSFYCVWIYVRISCVYLCVWEHVCVCVYPWDRGCVPSSCQKSRGEG